MCIEQKLLVFCGYCSNSIENETRFEACAAALKRGGNLFCVGPGYQRPSPSTKYVFCDECLERDRRLGRVVPVRERCGVLEATVLQASEPITEKHGNFDIMVLQVSGPITEEGANFDITVLQNSGPATKKGTRFKLKPTLWDTKNNTLSSGIW